MHVPALLPPRPRGGLRAPRPVPPGRKDGRLQRRSKKPPMPPGQADARLDGHPAQTGVARMDHPHRPDLRPGALAVLRLTTRAPYGVPIYPRRRPDRGGHSALRRIHMTLGEQTRETEGGRSETAGTDAGPGQAVMSAWQALAPLMDLVTPMALRVATTLRLADF